MRVPYPRPCLTRSARSRAAADHLAARMRRSGASRSRFLPRFLRWAFESTHPRVPSGPYLAGRRPRPRRAAPTGSFDLGALHRDAGLLVVERFRRWSGPSSIAAVRHGRATLTPLRIPDRRVLRLKPSLTARAAGTPRHFSSTLPADAVENAIQSVLMIASCRPPTATACSSCRSKAPFTAARLAAPPSPTEEGAVWGFPRRSTGQHIPFPVGSPVRPGRRCGARSQSQQLW